MNQERPITDLYTIATSGQGNLRAEERITKFLRELRRRENSNGNTDIRYVAQRHTYETLFDIAKMIRDGSLRNPNPAIIFNPDKDEQSYFN